MSLTVARGWFNPESSKGERAHAEFGVGSKKEGSFVTLPVTLSEIIPGYPRDAPQDFDGIWNANPAHLPDIALTLRSMLSTYIQARDEVPIVGAERALELLRPARNQTEQLGRLKFLSDRWTVYALDENLKRAFSYSKSGKFYRRSVHREVPSEGSLPVLPLKGKYLAVWGGDPSVLARREGTGESRATVAAKLAALRQEIPFADILFWHRTPGSPGVLYSLKAGFGSLEDGERVEFPDQSLLKEATS